MAQGIGAGIGAVAGGIGGAAIGLPPGVGSQIGSTLGMGVDALIAGKKAEEKADIPMYDPQQLLLLDEINRKRKELEMGLGSQTQTGLREVGQAGEGARASLIRASAGNAGATIDALLRSQKLQNAGANQVLAQGQQQIPYFTGLGESLQEKISQRALDLSMFDRVDQAAKHAQFGKDALGNLFAGQATGTFDQGLTGILDKIKGLRGAQSGQGAVGSPMPGMEMDPNQMSAPVSDLSAIGGAQVANQVSPMMSWP
jgi:hypothetical protein